MSDTIWLATFETGRQMLVAAETYGDAVHVANPSGYEGSADYVVHSCTVVNRDDYPELDVWTEGDV